MSQFRGSSAWKAEAFKAERDINRQWEEWSRANAVGPPGVIYRPYVKRNDGWIFFGPTDIRGRHRRFHFALQWLNCDKQLRVRVGCRYYTLLQAWKHWSKKRRRSYAASSKNEAEQALAIISLMLLQAKAYGLLPMDRTIRFDSSICKSKRKK